MFNKKSTQNRGPREAVWNGGCVSSTGEAMSVGRLVGWLAGRLVGFDPNTPRPRSRRIIMLVPPTGDGPNLVRTWSELGPNLV